MKEPSNPGASAETMFDAVRPSTATLALLLLQDAIRMGQLELAASLGEVSREHWPEDPGLRLVESILLARSGRGEAARRELALSVAKEPMDLVIELHAATLEMELREPAAAIRRLRTVIRRCPDYPGVAGTLAAALMPGPNYREILAMFHQRLRPRGYLEIGVETGATLGLARAERIVGIDPDLAPLRRERLAPHAELFEMKSQAFFEQHSAREVLGAVPLDLVFIDGLHRFEAALQDFLAVERWAHPDTVIVMHDALPIAPVYAEGVRKTRFWVGDVWKAVYVLCQRRPDLRIRIIPAVPSGLVVLRRCAEEPSLRSATERELLAGLVFPALNEQDPVWPAEFPLVTNDAEGYAEALGSSR